MEDFDPSNYISESITIHKATEEDGLVLVDANGDERRSNMTSIMS